MKNLSFDIGNIVVCDGCSKDFTFSNAQGGLLFCSKGYCPECAPDMLASVRKYGEEQYIRGQAEPGETFRDFILRMRGGNNSVTITSGSTDEILDMLGAFEDGTGIKTGKTVADIVDDEQKP